LTSFLEIFREIEQKLKEEVLASERRSAPPKTKAEEEEEELSPGTTQADICTPI
jgi:hypothetical protein